VSYHLSEAREKLAGIRKELREIEDGLGSYGYEQVQGPLATAEAYDQARVWGATIGHLDDGKVVLVVHQEVVACEASLAEAVEAARNRFNSMGRPVVGMDPAKPGGDRNGVVWRGLPQYPGLWNIPLDTDMVDRLKRGTNGQGGRQDLHRALVHRISPEGVLSIDEKLCKTLFAYCEGNFGHAEHLVPLAELVQQAQEACPPASLFEEAGK
jgi:hypothetical protein